MAAETAKTVIAAGQSLDQGFGTFKAAFSNVAKRDTKLQDDAFTHAVAPETFISRRDRIGGPAPLALDAAFDAYSTKLDALRQVEAARAARYTAAEKSLQTGVAALTET